MSNPFIRCQRLPICLASLTRPPGLVTALTWSVPRADDMYPTSGLPRLGLVIAATGPLPDVSAARFRRHRCRPCPRSVGTQSLVIVLPCFASLACPLCLVMCLTGPMPDLLCLNALRYRPARDSSSFHSLLTILTALRPPSPNPHSTLFPFAPSFIISSMWFDDIHVPAVA